MFNRIILIIIMLPVLSFSNNEDKMFKISFVDTPSYINGCFLFGEDHFRIKIEINNSSDSTYAFEKITPSGINGNPKLFIRATHDNTDAGKLNPIPYDYYYNDSFFIDIEPNNVYCDTIDFEIYYDLDLKNNTTYEVWLEYVPKFYDYIFKNKNRVHPIWKKKLKSNKIKFKME